jgi:hypothetical protein
MYLPLFSLLCRPVYVVALRQADPPSTDESYRMSKGS